MRPAGYHLQHAAVSPETSGKRLDTHLATVEAFADEVLISSAARARLRALEAGLPPFRHGIFECRLAAGEDQVDFCCKYGAGDLLDPAPPMADLNGRHLAHLIQELGRPSSPIGRAVDLLGLEFDVDLRVPVLTSSPSMFFAFSTDDTQASLLALDAIVDRLVHSPDAAWRAGCGWCADALPVGSHFNYVGLMLGREQAGLRIGVEGITPQSAVPDFLSRIGWPGPVDAIRAFLAGLPAPLQRSTPIVALDIGAAVGRTVGLEFLLCHDQAIREDRTRVMLDHLVGLGLCSPAKRAAVLGWTEPPPADDAGSRSWCDYFLDLAAPQALHRIVSHVKLSWTGHTDVRAKVYLETTVAP